MNEMLEEAEGGKIEKDVRRSVRWCAMQRLSIWWPRFRNRNCKCEHNQLISPADKFPFAIWKLIPN